MSSGTDGDGGGLFADRDPDETRFVVGGRPIPPSLRGQSGNDGVFDAPRHSNERPGPLGDNFWDDEPDAGRGSTTAQPQLVEEFWPGESEGFDDDDERVRGRLGGTLLFLVGMVLVVAVAVLFAALNALGVIGGTEESEAVADGVETGEVTGEAETAGDAATVDGLGAELGDQTAGQAQPDQAADPNALGVELLENPFVCDGEVRPFARLTNAAPSEQVAFVSPQSSGIRPGAADESGTVTMRWQCDPSQAPTVWEIAATGATSGRTVTFAFAGVIAGATEIPPATADGAVGAVPADQLTVVINENPFACNGETRPFARLSGAEPNEQIRFTSPESPNLRAGTADAAGELDVRWQCDIEQVGTTWNLTATGDQSERSVTFSVTGAAG